MQDGLNYNYICTLSRVSLFLALTDSDLSDIIRGNLSDCNAASSLHTCKHTSKELFRFVFSNCLHHPQEFKDKLQSRWWLFKTVIMSHNILLQGWLQHIIVAVVAGL